MEKEHRPILKGLVATVAAKLCLSREQTLLLMNPIARLEGAETDAHHSVKVLPRPAEDSDLLRMESMLIKGGQTFDSRYTGVQAPYSEVEAYYRRMFS